MTNETTYEFQSKCRVCLCQGVNNVDIFEDDPKCGKISVALMECTSINIEVGDHLPAIICAECLQNLQKWFEFRLLCQMSDQTMRHYLNFITNDVAEPLLSATLEIKRDPDIILKEPNDTVESKDNKSKKRKGKTKSPLTPEPVDPVSVSSSPASNSSVENPETESIQKQSEVGSNNNFIIQASECQQFQVQTPNNGYQAFIAKATNSQGQIIDIPILIQLAPTTEANKQEKIKEAEKKSDDTSENTEVMIVPDVLGDFVCQTCSKTYKTERQLNRHENVVHGERRYGCDLCSKKFTESSVLKLHKMAIHSAIRPYKCQFCEKSYTAKNHLRVHLRSHTGERPYKCQECHKLFSQKFLLNSHYKSVHANLRPFECNLCSKTFKRSYHLQTHIRIHKSTNQHKKPAAFECEECLKQFSNVRLFRRHQLWYHQGAPPFICNICNKKFVRKWDKQRHMKIHDHKRPSIKVSKSEAEAALKQIDSQDLKTT